VETPETTSDSDVRESPSSTVAVTTPTFKLDDGTIAVENPAKLLALVITLPLF
jgi:hypothetical protein